MGIFADKRLNRFVLGASNAKALLGDTKEDLNVEKLINIIEFYTDKQNAHRIETKETLKRINQLLKHSDIQFAKVPVDNEMLGSQNIEILEKCKMNRADRCFIDETYDYVEEVKNIDYNNMFSK